MPRILVVDASNLAARSQHVFNEAISADGFYTGSLYGAINELQGFISRESFDCVVAAMDDGIPAFRFELRPMYKQQRAEKRKEADDIMRERYKAGLKVYHRILNPAGVTTVRSPGWEADDVISALALHRLKEHNIVIYSSDKDFQVLSTEDGRVSCYDCYKKAYREVDRFYLLKRCLDPKDSDNLDGVTGIGPVAADKLIAEWLSDTEYDGLPHQNACLESFLAWCAEKPQTRLSSKKEVKPTNYGACVVQRQEVRANWVCTNLHKTAKQCAETLKFRKGVPNESDFKEVCREYSIRPLLEDMQRVFMPFGRLQAFPS